MEPLTLKQDDTIAAVATPAGCGGIAVIRISGPESINIVNGAWSGVNLSDVKSHTSHFGKYISMAGDTLDECVATPFIAPHSFTGENTIELSIHGSIWIQREILKDLVSRGARIAYPGEFTQRAFLNGKLDLSQAEGVADLIASSSKASHDMALNQLRGNFSTYINELRNKLIEFVSLLELELDFSEEDVEFADRSALLNLCSDILKKINSLASSFSKGAALKDGVPVVIAGIPNAGKSSLLNLLLNDDKAIVTEMPGTTRDIIEDSIEIEGVKYRFMDTAGLRETSDLVENIGVERALKELKKAYVIIWVIDTTRPLKPQIDEFQKIEESGISNRVIILLNKSDIKKPEDSFFDVNLEAVPEKSHAANHEVEKLKQLDHPSILFSTKTGEGLEKLLEQLRNYAVGNTNFENDMIVTNVRHYEALTKASEALERAKNAMMEGIPSDFVAQDIRESLHHLGEITGEITTDTLLSHIFSHFCIGK